MLAGFADGDQLALLAPYQDRYFEVVHRIWRDWSPDMARWFVSYAYPIADNPVVISATSDLINSGDLPPGLVRLLSEGRDGLRRALRCQERDRRAAD
jgi:aminopeptidase N